MKRYRPSTSAWARAETRSAEREDDRIHAGFLPQNFRSKSLSTEFIRSLARSYRTVFG